MSLALLVAPLAVEAQQTAKPVPGSAAHATAQRLLYSGQIARAIDVWQNALTSEPDSWALAAALGATLYADRQFARAAHWLQRASALRPDDWTLRLFLGTADYEAGQLAAADGEFQAIIKGSSQQGTIQIASDKLSRQYFHDQKTAEDRALAKVANPEPGPLWIGRLATLEPSPNSELVHDDGSLEIVIVAHLLGGREFTLLTGGDYVRWYGPVRIEVLSYASHRALITARVWTRDVETVHLSALRVRVQVFEYIVGAARLSGAAPKGSAASAYQAKVRGFDAVRAATRTGQWAEAERWYREAVQLAPDDPQAHAGLGLIRAEQGDLLTAEQEFTKALRRWPDYPEALFGVAMLHAWRGQTRENIAGLGRVIEVCPVLWEAYVKLAAAYGKLGLTPQAATAIRYAKEVYPDVAIPEAVKQWDAPSGQ